MNSMDKLYLDIIKQALEELKKEENPNKNLIAQYELEIFRLENKLNQMIIKD